MIRASRPTAKLSSWVRSLALAPSVLPPSRSAMVRLNDTRGFLLLYTGVLGVGLALTVLYLALAFSGTVPLAFDLDAEGTVPVWWSSFQLLGAGAVFTLLALRNRRLPGISIPLAGLAVLFMAMSLDETASLHETFGAYVDRLVVERSETAFSITGVWFAVLGVPLIAMLTLLFARLSLFFATVPDTLRGFAIGFVVFLGGALGVEALSNFVAGEGALRVWTTAWEEGFEMIGVGILLCTAIRFAALHPSSRDVVASLLRDASGVEPFGPFERASQTRQPSRRT